MIPRVEQRSRWRVAAAVAVMVIGAASYGQAPLELDRFGGLKSLSFGPGPFFRTHNDGQRWWLVTPDGGAFLSLGINFSSSTGDTERGTGRHPYHENIMQKYGSVEAWALVTRDRFKDWGMNTLGAWCSGELRNTVPYTLELSLGVGLWGKNGAPDFFSPEVEERIRSRAGSIDPYVNDPYLLGYYLDNEIPWAFDWRRLPDVFPAYVALPPEAPGKQRLIEFFKERYQTVDQFAAVWNVEVKDWADLGSERKLKARDRTKAQEDREAFVLIVARQYFKTATEAIRAKDKNHLILGCRLVWVLAPKPVVQACGEYCDVISINYYEAGVLGRLLLWLTERDSMRIAPDLTFKAFHELTNKPLLITEFSFRAMDSGVPNTYPPGLLLQPRVTNQKERAGKFEQCATTWMSQPYFLGYHWFDYADEPKAGRAGDGENGNYGLVTINDEPYTEFVERFKAVNRRVWDLHAAPGLPK